VAEGFIVPEVSAGLDDTFAEFEQAKTAKNREVITTAPLIIFDVIMCIYFPEGTKGVMFGLQKLSFSPNTNSRIYNSRFCQTSLSLFWWKIARIRILVFSITKKTE
jgi:hypothetical protein